MLTTKDQPLHSPKPEALGPGAAPRRGTRVRHRLRGLRIGGAILGVVLIAASCVVRFVVLPAEAKLPANSNTTNVYAGTAPVMLNTAALAPHSTAPLLLRHVPLSIRESVRVLSSNDADAVVDYRIVESVGGKALPTLDYKYDVSRTDLGAATSLSWPGLVATRGLTVSFPIGTQQRNYTGWVQETGLTTPLRFAGTTSGVKLDGKTYNFGFKADVFRQVTPAAPLTDREQLAMFPTGIPKAEIPTVVAQLHLSSSQLGKLVAVFSKLPNVVPLAYTYAATYTYWVAPRDGVVVDLTGLQTYAVELPASVLGVAVPIATVAQFSYTDTPATLVARVNEANHDAWALNLVGITLPLLALIIGVVLVAAAVLLRVRRPIGGPAAGVQREPVGGAGAPPSEPPKVTRKAA